MTTQRPWCCNSAVWRKTTSQNVKRASIYKESAAASLTSYSSVFIAIHAFLGVFILSWVTRTKIPPEAGILALWGLAGLVIRLEFSISDAVFEHNTKDVPNILYARYSNRKGCQITFMPAAIGKFFRPSNQLLVYSLQPWASRTQTFWTESLIPSPNDNNNKRRHLGIW